MTIAVSNLGKRFNREWIFSGLTREFVSGNIYVITGPNGSGKSTLMQVLWGQVPASEGVITYDLNDRRDGKFSVSTVPDDEIFNHISIAAPYMDLIEEFTLQEQVEFHFKFKKPSGGLALIDIIYKMQLETSIHKPIKQFSSGMKQRLKLGLAMFSEGEVLFLDEPTTNLDNRAAAWYMENLIEMAHKKLIFIATNQQSDFPANTSIINLTDIKRVTNPHKLRIQTS